MESTTTKTNYLPLVISGASGAGKVNKQTMQGSVVKFLIQRYPELFELSISLTTRPPRQTQLHGREYYFVSKEEFEKDISEGIFAEWCKVHDNFYGTHMGKMQEIIDRNRVVCLLIKICLLDIDVQGTKKIQKVIKTNNIWLDVPSLKVLEERLRGRSTDSEEVIIKRINNATEEIKQAHDCEFYSFIVNDKWENTEQQVLEHLRKWYPGAGL